MRHARPRSGHQRGFSLWELAILLGVLSIMLLAGVLVVQALQARQRETDRSALLTAADHAVAGFAAANGRLPCPDTAGTGLENCAAGVQKGWLPSVTLGLDASLPARGVQQIKYIAYRRAGSDLGVLVDLYNPGRWDRYSTLPPGAQSFSYGKTGLPDLCVALERAAALGASAGDAYVNGAGGNPLNVAYALAEAGQKRDAAGRLFDGALNGNDALPGLESPARAADASYDNRVLARSFGNLALALNCEQLTRGLDAMGQTLEVANEVVSQQEANKLSATLTTAVGAVKAVINIVKITLGVLSVAAAVTAMSVASALLATNIALCAAIITAPVGCPLVGVYGTAVGLAAAAIGLNAGAVAANVTALGFNTAATVAAGIAAGKANAATSATTPDSMADLLASLLRMRDAAALKARTDQDASAAAAAEAATALAGYNDAVSVLMAASHEGDKDHVNDAALAKALQDYVAYNDELHRYYDADGNAKAKRKEADATAAGASTALAAANTAAAISPATREGVLAATQAAAAAAASASTAAAAAASANPGNVSLATAASDASTASASAALDASSAAADPDHYVANKLALSARQQADTTSLNDTAASLAATAIAIKTSSDTMLAIYNSDVTLASEAAVYDSKPNKVLLAAFTTARAAYDAYVGKKAAAAKLASTALSSATTATDTSNAYNNLLNRPADGTGSGTPITISGGAEDILKAADQAGGSK